MSDISPSSARIRRFLSVAVVSTALVLFDAPQLPADAESIPFVRTAIDPDFYGDNKSLADIDGDGRLDVVVGRNELAYYRAPNWTRTRIGTAVVEFTTDMQSADVDRDGDVDIITPDFTQGVFWFENPRIGGGGWSRQTIGTGENVHDLEAGDVDGDGDVDVVTRGHVGSTIVWLQNSSTAWTKVILATSSPGEGLSLGDIDRDGDLDIAQNGWWLEAPDIKTSTTWRRHDFASGWPDMVGAHIADFNADGQLDIALAASESTGELAWYEAPATPTQSNWTKHTVDDSLDYVHTFKTGDFDLDGDLDIAFAEMAQSARRRVGVFLNDGSATTWTQQVVSTDGSHNIRVGDIGGDGDLDIVGANWQHAPVEVWENQIGNGDPQVPDPPTNLVATAVSGTQVDLSWSASADTVAVSEYRILRDGIQIGTTSATYFSDATATPNTAYRYAVVAVDASGNVSGASNTVWVTTPNPPVTDPPITDPPVTEPPVTEPPVTEPPVTEPPVTEPPVTEPPVTEPPTTGQTGDEFDTTTLSPAWTFTDPRGDSSWSLTANPGHLQLIAGATGHHDCWELQYMTCVRMLRPFAGDGVYEIKLDGVNLSSPIQSYGLLFSQDASNYVRFELWYLGGAQGAVWRTINGSGSSAVEREAFLQGSSSWLRVTKAGPTFTFEVSPDGVMWANRGTFTQLGFTPTQVGIHVSNDFLNAATTANVDYFHMPA